MSSLSVRDIQGIAAYSNTVRIPSGNTLSFDGNLKVPVWSTPTRPATPTQGLIGYNDTTKIFEIYTGTEWRNAGYSKTYPDLPVSAGLVLHLDANRTLANGTIGYAGNTWLDQTNIIGNVNIRNRSSDWSFVTEPATNLVCVFNNTNRTSSAGIDIPVNNGFNKIEGTIEIWVRPSDKYGGHGFFNNSDGASYTNASNWLWWGTWSNSDCVYFRQGNASTCCNDLSTCSFSGNYLVDQWQQFVMTWKSDTGRATMYRNGSVMYSTTSLPTNPPNSNPTNTGQLFNGHTRTDNMQFKGYCSQYRIYNRELSGTEVASNWNAFKTTHGLT